MGITEPRNDIEYVQTGQKGIAVAVDTITASSDVPKRMKPYDAARKSVIACVSDFAAKGVRPRFGLVSVTVPSSYDVKSIKETARGIADASKKFKIRMLGGDTSFGELSISICLFGLSKKPVGRIGAKTGDGIFTTGRFGYSAAGLHLMLSGKKPANSFEVKAKKAFCRPDARLDFGAAAARHFSSSIDSSDGMSLHELAQSRENDGTVHRDESKARSYTLCGKITHACDDALSCSIIWFHSLWNIRRGSYRIYSHSNSFLASLYVFYIVSRFGNSHGMPHNSSYEILVNSQLPLAPSFWHLL